MTNFRIGDRIKNIDPRDNPGSHVGEYGTVTDIDGDIVYVEYDNGGEGNSAKPQKYYQVVRNNAVDRSHDTTATTKHMNPIQSALKAVKRALMSPTERNLIDSGLMNECGTYTDTALEILAQAAAEADVAKGDNSTLISASAAILADKKAKKELSN